MSRKWHTVGTPEWTTCKTRFGNRRRLFALLCLDADAGWRIWIIAGKDKEDEPCEEPRPFHGALSIVVGNRGNLPGQYLAPALLSRRVIS